MLPDISPFLGLPELASAHGGQLDYWTGVVHWLMFFLLMIWTPYFIYVLFRFRKSKNPTASYEGAKGKWSTYGEIFVVIAELVLLFAFAIPTWASFKEDFPDESTAIKVRVVGEQFAWNVHYPGADGIYGEQDIKLVDTATNPLGINWDDPNSADDITTVNEIRLPVNVPVIIDISSKDVIHSFALNQMRIKQDAIPGIDIPVYFTPIKEGSYEIGCAQLCGLGHYRMKGNIHIQSAQEYEEWIQQKMQEVEDYGR